jgi:tetratricopeptide (TPR) repeat protein
MSADDRSDYQSQLAELQKQQGDTKAAENTMRKREALLEAAANSAPDVETAATFDAHRTDCYIQLHELDKAEALLSQRQKELPDDYNPPARLARVLFEDKKYPAAEASVDRALSLMTKGPRRIGILGLKGKILVAQNKPKDGVIREQLEVLRGLPATQKSPQMEAALQKELDALAHPPAAAPAPGKS